MPDRNDDPHRNSARRDIVIAVIAHLIAVALLTLLAYALANSGLV